MPVTIDVLASLPNYWRHLAPIVDSLRERGHDVRTWATRSNRPWGPWLTHAPDGDLLVVASWVDARRWPSLPTVYVEHGAGQSYVQSIEAQRDGYAGAPGLEHVRLFVGPGDHVADAWSAVYPQAAVASVGCPALDRFAVAIHRPKSERALVALTQHWRCGVVPETMPALDAYAPEIDPFEPGVNWVGHFHPRGERRTSELWKSLGVRIEPDPDVVLATADLLVADNTSLMYEAAALDIPVLAVNAPTYRRDVEHGLRFWSYVPGLEVNTRSEFRSAVYAALADPPEAQALRHRAARHVYRYRDGSSAQRAAEAIEGVL